MTHVLLDPASPKGSRTLYACVFGRGVYKSTDGGRSWTAKNAGLEGRQPFAWRLTPAGDGVLYLVVSRRSEGGASATTGTALSTAPATRGALGEDAAAPGVNGPTPSPSIRRTRAGSATERRDA